MLFRDHYFLSDLIGFRIFEHEGAVDAARGHFLGRIHEKMRALQEKLICAGADYSRR